MLHLSATSSPSFLQWQALQQQAQHLSLRQYYQTIQFDPHTPVKAVPLMAMDFETTGLDPLAHKIVSVGIVPFDLQRIRLQASQHWLVRPRRPLDEESIVFHGITPTILQDAPDLAEIMQALLQALAGHIVVVHCHAIERQFLDSALRKRWGEGIQFPMIDTMALEARWHRTAWAKWRDYLHRRPATSIRLHDSRMRYGLPPYTPHHALWDAVATAELLQAQIAHHFKPETPLQALWI